jgi:hypothetical protein
MRARCSFFSRAERWPVTPTTKVRTGFGTDMMLLILFDGESAIAAWPWPLRFHLTRSPPFAKFGNTINGLAFGQNV